MTIPKPVIPNEHGAWAVLFVPMATAIVVAERITLDLLWLVLASLSFFLASASLRMLLKRSAAVSARERFWLTVYGSSGLLFAGLLLMQGYRMLLPIGALAVVCLLVGELIMQRLGKHILPDTIYVLGLTMSAPAAYYVARGALTDTALLLWLWNMFFFESGVVYVHMKMRAVALKKDRLSWEEKLSVGWLNLVYHLVAIGAVVWLTAKFRTSTLVVGAFVPMVVHAIWGTMNLSPRVRFQKIGFALLMQSLLFAAGIALAHGAL